MRKLPSIGFAVLLLSFIGSAFVSSDPGPLPAEAREAGRQDSHVSYYQEHLARLPVSSVECR